MTKVFILTTAKETSFNPFALCNYNYISKIAELSNSNQHSRVSNVEEAELLLFISSRAVFKSDILLTDLFRKNYQKSLVLDFHDAPMPSLPGLYMTIPKHLHDIPIYQYGFYPRVINNNMLDLSKPLDNARYLYSFVGNVSNYKTIREKVINLQHPRGFVKDNSSYKTSLESTYVEIMHDSKFILCPRGISPSSFRVFETMRSGRVPVIISDEWYPLIGIDWEEFSVRISEKDIHLIPDILESLEDKSEMMGQTAREIWEKKFSLEGGFDWIINTCNYIQSQRDQFSDYIHRNIFFEIVQKGYTNRYVKEKIKALIGKV
ncbi:MAG: exostosin family protein [Cyanobacteria bacterium P01_F01_bin.150]